MKKARVLIVIAATLIMLAGCSPRITEGIVTETGHRSTTTIIMYIPIKVGDTTIMMSHFIHNPERWFVDIEGYDKDGELVNQRLWVSKEVFSETEVGGWFNASEKDASFTEPEYRERK